MSSFQTDTALEVTSNVCAVASIFGNALIITTFVLHKKWRMKMSSAKIVLISQAIVESLGLLSTFLYYAPSSSDQGSMCVFQSICSQCFIVGAVFLNALLAFEMGFICYEAFGYDRKQVIPMSPATKKARENFRLKAYAFIYALGSLISIIYICSAGAHNSDKYGVSGFDVCWLKTPNERLYFGYLLIWICMVISFAAIFYTITTINGVIEDLVKHTNLGRDQSRPIVEKTLDVHLKEQRTKYQSLKNTFRRLQIDAIVFFLLWIPNFILGMCEEEYVPMDWNDKSRAFPLFFMNYFGWSYGFWKAFIWIVFDSSLRQFWLIIVKGISRNIQIFLGCAKKEDFVTNIDTPKNTIPTYIKERSYSQDGSEYDSDENENSSDIELEMKVKKKESQESVISPYRSSWSASLNPMQSKR